MSSWAQYRQPANMATQPPTSAPLQQQHQLQQPLVPPQQVGVGGSGIQGTAHFGSQPVWPQNYNQLPMQPAHQPPPSNWSPNPNANAYQEHNIGASLPPPSVQNNNWPQQDIHPPTFPGPLQSNLPTSGYFLNQDSFIQPPIQPQQHYPSMQPSYSPPQQYQPNIQQPAEIPTTTPITSVSYSRQSTQPMDSVQNAQDYFANKTKNNNDGWGDWDWSDNSVQQQQQHQQPPPPPAPFIPDTMPQNSNAIEDSFRTEPNDNWQWGSTEESKQQQSSNVPDDLHQNSQQPPPQEHVENLVQTLPINLRAATLTTPSSQPNPIVKQSTLPGIQHQAVHSSPVVVKPTHLPLNDVSQSSDAAQSNNIPSPVYVSQAKPVSKPPRQYASPPGATNDIVNVIGPTTPPHAFQNKPESQTLPNSDPGPPPISAIPPPAMQSSTTKSNNPFKRAGVPQHHRAGIVATPLNPQQPSIVMPPAQFYATPPPPPEGFANPSVENHEVIAPDNSEVLHDNQEIAPNNDRNEYLQTSHLSEIGSNSDAIFNIEMHEQNNEADDFPPPGLSRLVLGQPENESRQVSGIGVDSSLNFERQADGEDTDPSAQRSTFTPSAEAQNNVLPNQIDITDRNLYLVPGESDVNEQRVVTGLENGPSVVAPAPPIQAEQREVELDGENIEDQQQPIPTSQHHHSNHHHHHHHRPVSPVQTSRDEPLEGGNSLDRQVQGSQHTNHENESNMTAETSVKDLSNISTGNDESDPRDRHYSNSRRAAGDDNKKRYESEDSEFSSDRERRRYREGSVRSERDRDRDSKERKRRDKREVVGDHERDRYRGDDRENKYRDKYYRERETKPERGGRYGSGRYDIDSKYETEGSSRNDRRRGGDRIEKGDRSERSERADREAYEQYRRYRKYNTREERDAHERRGGGRPDVDRRRSDRDYRDDRDHRRNKDHRDKPRNEYEEYRKTSSRNTRESDVEKESRLRDKDPRYAAHGTYSGYHGYGYDPYAAYYYEQMARTNPQAYSEWYKKYYGHAQAAESITNDGRESVHSGRSSANNEKDRPDNNLSMKLAEGGSTSIQQDPQRLTPHKFSNNHPIISLAPGLLVAVKSKYSTNGITNVVKIFKMGANDATNKLFQSFPGPLVRGITHKKTIIEFCEDQIRAGPFSAINRSRQNSVNSLTAAGQTNTASFTLMWNLLILLLRQNGVVVGTDIAELLMKNQQQFPYETPQSSLASSSNRRESLQSDEQGKLKENIPSDGEQDVDDSVADDRDESEETDSKSSSLSDEEITEKFRNYLLYGNVNEALDWATDNNLWGHALFLASKVDRRSHANVMMKFANKLALNDPLQTLYQLMSGRTPSSVTSVQDEKWGDWRPHLSMILSNTSQKPELDRKAITTLGDSLLNRGDLFAAHFCYLMAQVGFSKYPEEQNDAMMMQNSVRLVLLGASHHRSFEDFATNESIMMTEVYEYACSLNDDKFSLVEFQPYKFLLATRMLDYGYQLKCLMYMEQISLHIQRDRTKYEPIFINQVYELADRLKYYDPVLEKSMDEQTDYLSNHANGVPFEEQKWLQELRSLAAEHIVQAPSQEITQDYHQTSNVIDQQFTEINRQFNELNLQYSNTGNSLQDQQQFLAEPTEMPYNSQQNASSQMPLANNEQQQYPQFYNPIEVQQPQSVGADSQSNGNGYVQLQEPYQQPQHVYDPQQQTQGYPSYGHDEQQQQNTYWGNQAQIPNDETARPTISMPNSQKSGFYDESRPDDPATKGNLAKKTGDRGSTSAGMKSDLKNQSKGGLSSNQNSGWFGGIWNKLSLKPKNQMILPDDKNPAIVWDSEKKKWVNTDGEEESEANLKPPPKMSDLMPSNQHSFSVPHQQQLNQTQQLQQPLPYDEVPQQIPQQPSQPIPSPLPIQTYSATSSSVAQVPGEPVKQPSLQSNMFKMQRNRTLKNSYVDVFNPSGAAPKTTEQVLAPALPPAAFPVGGFFTPGAAPSEGAYQQQQHQPVQEGAPQFYNPTQFGGYQQQ